VWSAIASSQKLFATILINGSSGVLPDCDSHYVGIGPTFSAANFRHLVILRNRPCVPTLGGFLNVLLTNVSDRN